MFRVLAVEVAIRATLATIAVTMLLGVVLAMSIPVESQEGGGKGEASGYPAGGKHGPPPPDYAYSNGKVIVGGDVDTDCRSFIEGFDGGYSGWGNQTQAERVLEKCKQADGSSLNPPPEVRQEIREDSLADTGGIPLLPVAAVVLLLTGRYLLTLHRTG